MKEAKEPKPPKTKMGRPTAAEQRESKQNDINVTEENGKPRFVNRINGFPKRIRDGINLRVSVGDGSRKIMNWMIKNYHGDLAIPDDATIAAYIKKTRPAKDQSAKNLVDLMLLESSDDSLREAIAKLRLANTESEDPREDIEKLRKFLFIRLQKLCNFQEDMLDIKFEMVMTSQCKILHELANTILDYQDNLKHYSTAARFMVEMWFQEMLPLLKQAFENNADPAKAKAFMEEIRGLVEKMDFARIGREALAKTDDLEKKGVTDV